MVQPVLVVQPVSQEPVVRAGLQVSQEPVALVVLQVLVV